jgi:L-cystine transport system permease protein
MYFDVEFAINSFLPILSAAPMTLYITTGTIAIGLVHGYVLALFRIYKIPILEQYAKLFVSLARSVPVMVLLYMVYCSLPIFLVYLSEKFSLGLTVRSVPPVVYAIITYSVYTSAALSEMIRSALASVDRGQVEAAYSIGLTTFQAMRRIIIPQALVVAVPVFGNIFITIMKGSALAVYVGAVELFNKARQEASNGLNFIEAYIVVSLIYWALCVAFEKLFLFIESKLQYENNISVLNDKK